MRQFGIIGISFLCLLISMTGWAAEAATSPVGYWKTIDDVTGQPRSILQIAQQADSTLTAKVVKIFPRPGHSIHERCQSCDGARHNQPILGMQVLEGIKPSSRHPSQWVNGRILDPLNGKTYNCNLTVLEQGKELMVRGYIGMPLFGRSQTWMRVNDMNA